MNDGGNKKSFDGIRVIVGERTFDPRCTGGVDMLVDGKGALLAFSPGDGSRRLPNASDLLLLISRGIVKVVPAADETTHGARGPLRSVSVLSTRLRSFPRPVAEPARIADRDRRHGPPTPMEMADHVASTMAFQPVVHCAMSVRAAYVLYLDAMFELNARLGRHSVEPISASIFNRRVEVARFLAADEAASPAGATIH